MENNLVLKKEIEEVTLTSLEVAEMLGKKHTDLLQEIEGRKDGKNVGILQVLENGKFPLSKFFKPSTYKAGTREYKCYEITKMGCHMLGNKLQGEKGILFTAKYVERFNEMEKSLKSGQALTIPQDIIDELKEAKSYYKIQPRTVHEFTDYIKKSLKISKANDEFEQVKMMVFTRLQINKWSDIELSKRISVLNLIDDCVYKVMKLRPYEQTSLFD